MMIMMINDDDINILMGGGLCLVSICYMRSFSRLDECSTQSSPFVAAYKPQGGAGGIFYLGLHRFILIERKCLKSYSSAVINNLSVP